MSVSTEQVSPVESLTAALIDANDQLLALYDMATLHTDSLDEHQSVNQILHTARGLMHVDELEMVPGEHVAPTTDRRTAAISVTDPSGTASTLVATRSSSPFTTGDAKLLTAVAHLAMRAQHTARMHAAAVEQAIVRHEHDLASELVQRALPADRPHIPCARLFARTDPARTAGGDLYSFSFVGDTFHFVVGDVSGKGLPAALMMSNVVNAAQRSFTDHGEQGPAAVLGGIDRWMHDALSDADMFVTLIAGSFDPRAGRLALANAGHSPVYFVHDGAAESIEASRPPIGVLPNLGCEQIEHIVAPSDRFVGASDGFPEQVDDSGTMYGEERFEAALIEPADDIEEFGSGLFDTVETFAGNSTQSDDRTLFMLEFGTAS